jgi:hypothetical protein
MPADPEELAQTMNRLGERIRKLEERIGEVDPAPTVIFVWGDLVSARGEIMTRDEFRERWPDWTAPVLKLGGADFLLHDFKEYLAAHPEANLGDTESENPGANRQERRV